jgi:hypothetical protein
MAGISNISSPGIRFPWQDDELKNWAPSEKRTAYSFAVKMQKPFVDWSFEPGSKTSLRTDASIEEDWVNYYFTYSGFRWDTKAHFKPGTAWASTGTLALANMVQVSGFSCYGRPWDRCLVSEEPLQRWWTTQLKYDYDG